MSHSHHHQLQHPGAPPPQQPQPSTSAGIAKPHKHDVLLGRGGASNHHHGNAVFRSVVSKTRPMYRQVPKHQKIIVARSIVHAVSRQDPPGRFLERRGGAKKGGGGKKGATNLWYEVPFERAVEKAKQALRERGRDEEDGTDDDDEEGTGAGAGAGGAAAGGHRTAGTALGRPAAASGAQQLSPADEAVAARYRNMLAFGVAPSVVRSKMDSERVAPRIAQSVLSGGGGGGGGAQPQHQQPQRHVQFASGTNTPTQGHGHGHGSFSIVPAKRRVSSVLLSMFGFGEDDGADGGNGSGNGNGSGASKPRGLPQEVLDVLEEIVPEGDGHTGPAAAASGGAAAGGAAAGGAAAGAASATSPPAQSGGGGNGGPAAPTSSSQRRRSSIFNLFRRKSRSVGGGTLTFAQRSCTSLRYDSESHRKLLVELQADGVDVEGDGDGSGGQAATAVGTSAATGTSGRAAAATLADRRSIQAEKGQQRKRKASSMAVTSPGKSRASLSVVRQQQQIAQQQQQKSRPTSIAEAAALVAAETELEEMEPEDVHAQPKRISFSPALFGNLFGSFSAGNVDGAGNPVEAPGTTTMAQAAAASSSSAGGHPAEASSPGLLRQSTSAARRSLVATMNLFQQATGREDPLADTNRSEGSYADGEGGASEPNAKRRRRSTWLSGLRFSTMPAAVESATSAVAAAQAVQGMGLVKDDDDDDDDSIAQKPAAVDGGL